MTLLLRTSRDLPPPDTYRHWLVVTDTPTRGLDPAAKLPDLARRLEETFGACRDTWWGLAQALAGDPGAELSHTVSCGSFGSDFGLMLAWDLLAQGLATGREAVLMVCDDPWLFRQIGSRPGIEVGKAPGLLPVIWKRAIRGFAARCRLALRLIGYVLATRGLKSNLRENEPVLLVYGHPSSRADGLDAYFGTLMRQLPELKRLLHTDCPPLRAGELAADGRTASLHAWGTPLFALTMPLWTWRPRALGEFSWLVRRAAAKENGGGGPAMNRWQGHCQSRFLRDRRPRSICWPWENHAWERGLCRAARQLQITTVGYQHTVIGPHQINYSIRANPDGAASLPDRIFADGPAYRDELLAWGIPSARLTIAGAWRFEPVAGSSYDRNGPVFVPLSAIPAIARLQIEAARRIAAGGRVVLVKEHPMYPLAFAEEGTLRRTTIAMPRQPGLSAVLYATGTSGLEALLLGLPAMRLLAEDRLSIDVLPAGLSARTVTLDDVVEAVGRAEPVPPVPFASVLAPVDMEVWKSALINAIPPQTLDGES